jgi:TRAP-type C4-dicarboxylate transport system permease small subunit
MTAQSSINTLVRFYDIALRLIISLIFFAILCLVFLGVIGRLIPAIGALYWTEEISFFLATWLFFLAIAPGIRLGMNMSIDLFVLMLPRGLERIVRLVGLGLVAAFLIMMIINGWKLAIINSDRPSAVLFWPLSWAYLALPVGGLLGLFETIAIIVRVWSSGKAPAAGDAAGVA